MIILLEQILETHAPMIEVRVRRTPRWGIFQVVILSGCALEAQNAVVTNRADLLSAGALEILAA